ncbi:MAG: hypothetical protein R2736_23300 [Solirubrobacterales bacterium]
MSRSANLAHGTWEQAEAMVGEVLAVTTGVDVVTAADIRRKLEVLGVDCPLHTDEDVARAHGRATIVAPASMLRVWAMPAYWAPGSPPPDAAPFTRRSPPRAYPARATGSSRRATASSTTPTCIPATASRRPRCCAR